MCSPVLCGLCKKMTWSGCGQHIEEALEGVALIDRCAGHESESTKPGLLSKIFGKRK